MTISISAVLTGRIAPLGPQAVPSGFVKHRVPGRVAVAELGLDGDEQADLSVHGGPEKAVYGYAAGHYSAWCAEFPEHIGLFVPGGLGENLTIDGLVEEDLCVGDVHRIGTALLQVCQPRQPCFKFALHFGDSRLPKAMVRTGRAGWYYRVLEAGDLGAGDDVSLVDRPQPDFRFSRLVEIINTQSATRDEIATLAHMPQLASSLRKMAQQRVEPSSQ